MKTILKVGYERVMELFYKDKSLATHLRDIARKTRLNENSATRFLNQLEREQILSSRKEGNLKKYLIQKNKKTFAIFSLFDVDRFDKLPSIRKNAINSFLQQLKEKPIIAVLFGSTARGNFTKGSDVDFLFVINKKINTESAEDYAESQTGIKINCIQIKYDDFSREIKIKQDKVIQSAINSGYPITNHILYYRMVL